MAVIAHVILRGHPRAIRRAASQGWLARAGPGRRHRPPDLVGRADCHNLDVWDCEAAFTAFGEQRLGPAMAAIGVEVQPEATFYQAHEVYLPQRAVIAPTAIASGR